MAFPVSICLARCSSVKKCCQGSVPCASSELAVFQTEIKSSADLNLFQDFFGGGTVNVPGKFKSFLEEAPYLQAQLIAW